MKIRKMLKRFLMILKERLKLDNETGKYDKYGFVKQIDDFLKDYEKHNDNKK